MSKLYIHTEECKVGGKPGWKAYSLDTGDGHTVSGVGETEKEAVGSLILYEGTKLVNTEGRLISVNGN